MKRKDLAARRERNAELGRRDHANRCGWCRLALPLGGANFTRVGGLIKFCSLECLASADEFLDGLASADVDRYSPKEPA